MDVWISIKGVQKADGESNALELNTIGKFEKIPGGYKLTYEESETTGMEGVTTTLLVKPSTVTLERQGTMNSLFVLEQGRTHDVQLRYRLREPDDGRLRPLDPFPPGGKGRKSRFPLYAGYQFQHDLVA